MRRREPALLLGQQLHGIGLRLQHDLASLPCLRRVRRAALLLGQFMHRHWLVLQHHGEPANLLYSMRRHGPALLHWQHLQHRQHVHIRHMHCLRRSRAELLL